MIELKGWMVWIPLTGLLLHFLSGQLHFPWPNSDSEWHRCLHQWVGNPEVTRSCFPENFPEVSGDVTKSDLLIKEYRLATKNLASIGEFASRTSWKTSASQIPSPKIRYYHVGTWSVWSLWMKNYGCSISHLAKVFWFTMKRMGLHHLTSSMMIRFFISVSALMRAPRWGAQLNLLEMDSNSSWMYLNINIYLYIHNILAYVISPPLSGLHCLAACKWECLLVELLARLLPQNDAQTIASIWQTCWYQTDPTTTHEAFP